MDIPKVAPHHPATTQNAITSGKGACQSCRTPVGDLVRHGGAELQKFLGHHHLLVDIVCICQVPAEGTGLQRLPTLVAFDVPCIPLGGSYVSLLQPAVGFDRELSPNLTWGADYPLHLGCVCLKPHPLKQAHKNIQCALQEFGIPRSKVCVMDIKDGKEVAIRPSNSHTL